MVMNSFTNTLFLKFKVNSMSLSSYVTMTEMNPSFGMHIKHKASLVTLAFPLPVEYGLNPTYRTGPNFIVFFYPFSTIKNITSIS
jgi:hypothetical protein